MATLTGSHAASTYPVGGAGPANLLHVAWGTYTLAADPAPNDVIEFCKVPAGAIVIGGWLQGVDVDTDATETFDIDVGWAANGTDAADTDGFGNFGVQTGDASVHLPVAGIYLPFANIIQSAGFKKFAAETKIIGTVIDDAATGGTGLLKVVVLYVMVD